LPPSFCLPGSTMLGTRTATGSPPPGNNPLASRQNVGLSCPSSRSCWWCCRCCRSRGLRSMWTSARLRSCSGTTALRANSIGCRLDRRYRPPPSRHLASQKATDRLSRSRNSSPRQSFGPFLRSDFLHCPPCSLHRRYYCKPSKERHRTTERADTTPYQTLSLKFSGSNGTS